MTSDQTTDRQAAAVANAAQRYVDAVRAGQALEFFQRDLLAAVGALIGKPVSTGGVGVGYPI
jgi:hypothetical protein